MKKFEKYLKECIINDLSPADFNLIEDGQTKWIINKIKTLIKKKDIISVLDYGCGNMRLFNALLKENLQFKYVGIDKSLNEDIKNIITENEMCTFVRLADITQIKKHSFDIICLVNVIHEISIIEFSEIIGIIKIMIKPEGHFLLMDMPVLPKGELLGLPYFPSEIINLFFPIDYKLETESGYPIIACDIIEHNINFPYYMMEMIYDIIKAKRNFFSYFAFKILNDNGVTKFNYLFNSINTKMSDEELFGYVVHLSGLANYRLVEYKNANIVNEENEFYVALIKLYIDTFNKTGKQIKISDVYDELYPQYTMLEITQKLKIALGLDSFFMLDEDTETLCATEKLDNLENDFSYDDLRRISLCEFS